MPGRSSAHEQNLARRNDTQRGTYPATGSRGEAPERAHRSASAATPSMRQPFGRRAGKPGKVPAGGRRSSARLCGKGRRRDGAGSDQTAPNLHVAGTSGPHTRPACLIAGGCRAPSRRVARIAAVHDTASRPYPVSESTARRALRHRPARRRPPAPCRARSTPPGHRTPVRASRPAGYNGPRRLQRAAAATSK